MLRILACLTFLACASAHLVARADDRDQTQKLGNAASLERLHQDATPADDLSATEAEQLETDAALGALSFRLTTRIAPIECCASPAAHTACAFEWPAQPLRSAVMAQGPP